MRAVIFGSVLLCLLSPALVRAEGPSDPLESVRFSDLEPGEDVFYAMSTLGVLGIMQGYGDGSVRPDEPLSRAAFARMAVSVMQDAALAERLENSSAFSDAPSWARGPLAVARLRGLVQWNGGWEVPVLYQEAIGGLMRLLGYEWESSEELFDAAIGIGLVQTAPEDPEAELTRGTAAELFHSSLMILHRSGAPAPLGEAQAFAQERITEGELVIIDEDELQISGMRFAPAADLIAADGDPAESSDGRMVQGYLDEAGRVALIAPIDQGESNDNAAAVLAYHHIVEGDAGSAMEISRADFARQIEYMVQEDYIFLTLEEFAAGHREGNFPECAVLITFDDGYRSFYEHAFPVLREHGVPAVVFPIVSYRPSLAQIETNFPHMSFREIRSVLEYDDLFDVGSHTYDLHHWRDDGAAVMPEPGEHEEDYRARIEWDLRRSRDYLQMQTRRPVNALAWPYGIATAQTKDIADELGFELLFETVPAPVTPETPADSVPRYAVSSGDLEQFVRLLGDAFADGEVGNTLR